MDRRAPAHRAANLGQPPFRKRGIPCPSSSPASQQNGDTKRARSSAGRGRTVTRSVRCSRARRGRPSALDERIDRYRNLGGWTRDGHRSTRPDRRRHARHQQRSAHRRRSGFRLSLGSARRSRDTGRRSRELRRSARSWAQASSPITAVP